MTLDQTITTLNYLLISATVTALFTLLALAHLTACKAITAHRRLRHHDHQHHDQEQQHDTPHDPPATQAQAWADAIDELDHACCEHWWTTAGTHHTPTCPNHPHRSTR